MKWRDILELSDSKIPGIKAEDVVTVASFAAAKQLLDDGRTARSVF